MELEHTMKEALAARSDAVALACMDTRAGLLVGIEVRGDALRDDVELAAFAAADLCAVPSQGIEGDRDECDEAFVSSSRWVHAYARVPGRRELVFVGLAPGDTNIALLRDWIRHVAESVRPAA